MKCQTCGTEFEGNFCPGCGTPADPKAAQAPSGPAAVVQTRKKPIYQKWWFWVLIVFAAIIVIANLASNGDSDSSSVSAGTVSSAAATSSSKPEVIAADFSTMDKAAIQSWADANQVTCKIDEEYSDTAASGSFVSQSVAANSTIHQGDTIKIVFSLGKEPTTEYKNALKKAESYSKTMNMSKQAIYDQLVSEYGEKFPADAAQYAIDNVQADWNANALAKAKSYQTTMSMSKSAIYDQLTSQYGEKFTASEAQYAIDHLDD